MEIKGRENMDVDPKQIKKLYPSLLPTLNLVLVSWQGQTTKGNEGGTKIKPGPDTNERKQHKASKQERDWDKNKI